MLFTTQIAAILAMSIAGTHAYPSPSPALAVGDVEGDLRVVGIEHSASGDLIVYGDANPDTAVTPRSETSLTARETCTNEIKSCNGEASPVTSHKAWKPVCQNLLKELKDSTDKLPKSPRSICLGSQKNGKCCVSWSEVPNRYNELKRKDMWKPANLIYGACDDHSMTSISGRDVSAGFNGGCITVCLSNRPDGCS